MVIILIILILTSVTVCFILFALLQKDRKKKEEILKNVSALKNENQKLIREIESIQLEKNKLDKLARIVNHSPNAIMLMDAEGKLLYVNQGFEQMYEYSLDQFIKVRGNNIRKTSFNPAVIERIERCIRTRKPVKYEAINITRTGKEIWTQTALLPIIDDNNNVDGLVTIDSDIHNRIVLGDNLIVKLEDINAKIDRMSRQFEVLVSETTSLFESINQSKLLIEQTDQIIKFIKEISDKTKILGINATIEASLAGIHGRGFRIIANEIVNISNITIHSVSQIGGLLNSVGSKQEQLIKEKATSEETIIEHEKLMSLLKNQIIEVEASLSELKSLG
jgi:PAS domain S-box-containing protein